MSIDLPRILPDGSTLLQDHDFLDRLRAGDATVGWLGDDRLGVYLENNCLAIKRLCEDGELRTICRSKPGVRYLNTDTLRFLAAHDSRGAGHDVVQRVIADYDRRQKEQSAALKELCDETADRMEFALMKDIGTHEGSGLRHRQYTGIDLPKKADSGDQ